MAASKTKYCVPMVDGGVTKNNKMIVNICRTCLGTNVKMYRLCELNTFDAYTQLTGVENLGLYPYICYECAARLRKSEEFRSNCLKALETLCNKQILEDIVTDRNLKGLKSPLQVKMFDVIDCRDTEISNEIVNIKVETINEYYNNQNCVIQEYIESNTHESDVEFKDFSCELDEHSYLYNNSDIVEEKHHIKNVTGENKKRKIEQTKKSATYSVTDKKPLSKIKGKKNKNDKLTIEDFKEYATFTTMTAEEAKREVYERKDSRNYKESLFKCNICYRGFVMKNTYDKHMTKHSVASGKYKCEFCFMRFSKKNIYNQHIAECHKVKISCKKCPHVCFSPSKANIHMKRHKGVKYTCDKCPQSFSVPSSLISHKRSSHPTDSVCTFCGNVFMTDKGLQFHISRTHKQQIPDNIKKDRKPKGVKKSQKTNEIEIEIEPMKEHYNSENSIIQEFIESNHESDVEDKDFSEFDEHSNSYNNSVNIEEKHDIQDVMAENKRRKIEQTNKREISSETDDEPLSIFKSENFENDKQKEPVEDFEEYATFTTMTPAEAKREIDQRKESDNYKNNQFKCNFCFLGFAMQNTFENHMKKHSLASGKYECEFCFVRFTKKFFYSKHITDSHKVKISCKKCPYICSRPSQAKIHMKSHQGVEYSCDQCSRTFSVPNSLLSHKRLSHPTNIICAFCGDNFVTEKGLKSHISRAHKQEQNASRLGPSCVECNVHFATETAWKRHLVLSEKHRVSNGCKICGERFADKEQLKSHMITHGETKPRRYEITSCPICKETLKNAIVYSKHMVSKHPDSDFTKKLAMRKTFICEYCGKGFKAHAQLVYHRNTHTKERPYKCKVCEKAFFTPASFYLHKRTHITHRAFECNMCSRVFKLKTTMEKHIKTSHLNIRQHMCDICGKAFPYLCEVKYHKQHVHENVPYPKRDRSKRN